jgi:hypothetical protein
VRAHPRSRSDIIGRSILRLAGIVVASILIMLTAAGAAETVRLAETGGQLSVRVVESDVATTVLEYSIAAFTKEAVDVGGQSYFAIDLAGGAPILRRGLPEVPCVARSIVIPDDAEMAVRVVSSHYVDFTDVAVAPSKGVLTRNMDPATVPRTFDAVYESDSWYPERLVYAREPYIMRDVRGLTVIVNPIQYNPGTHTLRVYDSVTVEVSEVGPAKVNALTHRPASMNSEFRKIYERHFLNFASVAGTRYPALGDVGGMLVICYDDADFLAAMQPLVDWKNQMGVPCEMVTVTDAGGTAANIKDYITTYYDENDLAFVLLVGDIDQLPSFTALGGASDPTYSTITADSYPDIFVGRFSASAVAHVQTQVERTIDYEKTPQAGADWYHKGTGIASNQGPGDDGEFDYQHVDNIRDDLLGFTYTDVDQIYDPTGTAAMVSSALNEGRSVINYCGHGSTTSWGSTGFSNSHVNALTNDNMLPFIFSVACVNGQFTYSTCFAEAWMRATNGGEPTGAIGTYMSSINQSWNPPMDAEDEMDDILVGRSGIGARRTFGGLCYNGSSHMMDVYGSDGEDMFLTWHIFGDPSLRVRTDSPATLSVSHSGTIDAFASTFEVDTGVPEALAALYCDGVLYGSALSGPSGVATIDIDGPLPENTDLTVTVTGFNARTYIGSVYSGGSYIPAISVDPLSFEVALAPDEAMSDTLSIENVGDPLSNLHYDIEVLPADADRVFTGTRKHVTSTPTGADERSWIELLTPNGGESIEVGSVYDITWDSGGAVGFIRIECSSDGGASWATIVGGTENDGLFEWTVDAPHSDNCLIRVSKAADPAINDTSDWAFSVFELVNWLSVTPMSGDVTVGSRAALQVLFDSSGLSEGDYHANIVITSNGGDPVVVPVLMNVSATGVGELETQPTFAIRGVHPNPFNPVTTIAFSVPMTSSVRLAIYDVSGRLVRVLLDSEVDSGDRTVVWDGRDDRGRDVGSGVYFCRMEADGFGDTAKMVLMK